MGGMDGISPLNHTMKVKHHGHRAATTGLVALLLVTITVTNAQTEVAEAVETSANAQTEAAAAVKTNTKTGSGAGISFTTGTNNTAVGYSALKADTTGSRNTAVGSLSLSANLAGANNSALGFKALQKNTGSDNTALGQGALQANITGASNTGVGYQSLFKNTVGNLNTAIGDGSLMNNTGSGNIALGQDAGFNLTTGNNNIDIGNPGIAGESGIIRIGTMQSHTYLAGIIHGNGSGLTGLSVSAAKITGAIYGSKLASNLNLAGTTKGTFRGSLNGNAATATFATTAGSSTTADTATFATTSGNVTDIVAIANGGTGSATQNFVDLSTAQSVAGVKDFTDVVNLNTQWSVGNRSADNYFEITELGGSGSRMVIQDGTGNVGIGETTDPVYKLDVLHGGSTGIRSKSSASFSVIDIDAASGDAALRFAKAGVNQWNTRNNPSTDDYQIFELGGGGERLRIENSSGNVGIGRPTGALTNKLEVEGDASKTTATAWLANSDRRIKQDIKTIDHALEKIEQVRLVDFRYTDDYRKLHPSIEDKRYMNVIAQEFTKVFPDHVNSSGEKLPDGGEILQVDTYPLTIYSAAAIQELAKKLDSKESEIARLKAENVAMKKQIASQAAADKQIEARLARLEQGATSSVVPVNFEMKR